MNNQSRTNVQTLAPTRGANALAVANRFDGYDEAKIELIKKTVAKGASNDELELFLHLASTYHLDPFLKEIWFIKRYKKEGGQYVLDPNSPALIMTSRDGYLKISQMNPAFDGLNSFEVREGDEFEYDSVNDTVKHKFGTKRGKIIGAWAKCLHKTRKPAVVFVPFDEYNQESNVWKTYPSAMIRKVAEVIVLKRQFSISGLVTQEELTREFESVDGNVLDISYELVNDMSRPVNTAPIAPPVSNASSDVSMRRESVCGQSSENTRPESSVTDNAAITNSSRVLDNQRQAVLKMAEAKHLSALDLEEVIDGATGGKALENCTQEDLSKVIQSLNKWKPNQNETSKGSFELNEDDLPF
jgi:phage recombination protein Bet